MKLQFRICDDNEHHLKEIEYAVASLKKQHDVTVLTFVTAKDLLASFDDEARNEDEVLDFVLLDIELPEEDGIEAGKQIKECYPEVCLVFVTSYAEYAVKGYEAKAYRYLLKPITAEAIGKVITDFQREREKKKRLVVRDCEIEKMILLDDIIYITAEDKYTIIYTETERYFDNKSLQYYEERLQEYGFCRAHRKYLVNLHHHKAMKKGNVILSNEIEIPLSRRKESQYREKLLQMMEKSLL